MHRCFQRHGISRLPELTGDKPPKQKFKRYPIGFFHVDIAEVRTETGKLYLFVAIDRTSKFAYAELLERSGKLEAAQLLRNLVAAVPYRIHIVLSDNGIQFTNRKRDRYAVEHIFNRVCQEHGIEHRLTNAYNFAKRVKTLQGLTPYEYIMKCWQQEPERFKINPTHHIVGLNT